MIKVSVKYMDILKNVNTKNNFRVKVLRFSGGTSVTSSLGERRGFPLVIRLNNK